MKDDQAYFQHIVEAADKISRYVDRVSLQEFINNDMAFDAATRQIMIIGEAVTNISEQCKEDHPGIPWQKIVGMRNRLIHEYFGVDPETVWETAHIDVPQLRAYIAKLIQE